MLIFSNVFLRNYWADFTDLGVYRWLHTWSSERTMFQTHAVINSRVTANFLTPTRTVWILLRKWLVLHCYNSVGAENHSFYRFHDIDNLPDFQMPTAHGLHGVFRVSSSRRKISIFDVFFSFFLFYLRIFSPTLLSRTICWAKNLQSLISYQEPMPSPWIIAQHVTLSSPKLSSERDQKAWKK